LKRPFGAAADLGRGDISGCEEAAGPLGFGGFFLTRQIGKISDHQTIPGHRALEHIRAMGRLLVNMDFVWVLGFGKMRVRASYAILWPFKVKDRHQNSMYPPTRPVPVPP
jgi:hypothetical protein